MTTLPEIHGDPPSLTDAICEEVRRQEYWYRGELCEEANVVFLRFAGIWHRLNIDCGVIFWRSQTDDPDSFDAPEIDASYRVVDVSEEFRVRGERLIRYEMNAIDGGAQVEFVFANGQRLLIRNTADHTSLAG